jgi:uncharacterized protein YndB with AHSA1/START domain
MSEIRITRDYPHPPQRVWRAMTDPKLVPRWTSTGRGARPDGFEPVVGRRFRFVGKAVPGWDGIVRCEILEVHAPALLRYSWQGSDDERPTEVTCRIEPSKPGARMTYEHTGFAGIGGLFMSRLLGHVRRGMLDHGLPAVLDELDRAEAR